MVSPQETETDGFTRNFDRLIEPFPSVDWETPNETMANLALVKDPLGPFAFDLNAEHSPGHIDCPACQASNAALVVSTEDFAAKTFKEAARFWMLHRKQNPGLRENTHAATQTYINALNKFFGRLHLRDITPGHLRSYQIARLHNALHAAGQVEHPWKVEASDSMVNHELSVLGQMMTFARLWHRLKPYYFPLKQKSWSPCIVLSEEQEEQLWKTAARRPDAALAYWIASITNNTTASGCELRGLRLKHIFMTSAIAEIYIPEDSVKNGSRPRRISLNNVARWAVGECLKRALRLGSCEPEHYLFPFCKHRGLYIPTKPASRFFLRKSWAKLQQASGFLELTPHDLRHQCITKMLENGVNPETVIAIAGHVGRKMMEYYAHQRRQVKYAAVLTLEARIEPKAEKENRRKTG